MNVGLWILQIGAAGMFLMVGFLSSPAIRRWSAVDAIGLGQWFRYVTGSLEVLGAVLLWSTAERSRRLLLVGDAGRGANALFVVGGSPLSAIILLIVTAYPRGTTSANDNVLAGLR